MEESKLKLVAELLASKFRFETDCMSEKSTAARCKESEAYCSGTVHRLRVITTRLEEIQVLISAYKLRARATSNDQLRNHLAKRSRTLLEESQELREEAENITAESLVSKTQALANADACSWFAEK